MDREIPIGTGVLEGNLSIPKEAKGLVLFAHGTGSSRFSPRNQMVAKYLEKNGIGTFLFDLLTDREEKIDESTREFRFDIPFLAERLLKATDWAMKECDLNLGYFGASTGAAAALVAAEKKGASIKAVVSRGGRPDLAGSSLPTVVSSTLLIVGSLDEEVLALNQKALEKLTCPKKLEIVPNASHLFEEPGTLEVAARLASDWFLTYF